MQWFVRALLLFALMSYAHKAGPSWFLSLCEVARILRGLLATLEFRLCGVLAHLFGLCCDHVFAFDYIGWMGMLCWETSQYLHCVVVTLGMPCLYNQAPLVEGLLIWLLLLLWLCYMILLV